MVLDAIKSGAKLGGKLFVAGVVILVLLAVATAVIGTLLFSGAEPSSSASTQLESYKVTASNDSAVLVVGRVYNPSDEPERVVVSCTMTTDEAEYSGMSVGSVGAGYQKEFVVGIDGISENTTTLDRKTQTSCEVRLYTPNKS